MRSRSSRSVFLVGLVGLMACGGDAAAPAGDAASAGDAGDPGDAGFDADLPPVGFGALSGACDVLDDELTSATPSWFESAIDFPREFDARADAALLTPGGQVLLATPNAGGSSGLSEVFAYELLQRCEAAPLLKTETQVVYDTDSKITDLLVEVDGEKIGVSVTRAVAFPFDDPYTTAQAKGLLEGKLADILLSSASVSAADRWTKQILAVLAYGPGHAASLEAALAEIDPAVVADTIVWVLVTDGFDHFIYCNGPCTGAQ